MILKQENQKLAVAEKLSVLPLITLKLFGFIPIRARNEPNAAAGRYLGTRSVSPCRSELKEKDPCHPLAHRGSSTVGEGHQEHHRGPGTMCLQHCSWGQLLKGKILLQDKKREKKNKVTSVGITFRTQQLLTTRIPAHRRLSSPDIHKEKSLSVAYQRRWVGNTSAEQAGATGGTRGQSSTHLLQTHIHQFTNRAPQEEASLSPFQNEEQQKGPVLQVFLQRALQRPR